MDIISYLEAKKARKAVGKLPTLTTKYKKDAVGAINELDYLLGLLIPDSPPDLSSKTLTISGTSCLLSNNVPDNTGGTVLIPGSLIKATRSLLPESSTISSFGAGNTGSLSVELNSAETGVRALIDGSDVGTYGELVITRNQSYPLATPGFWEDLDAKYKAIANIPYGYNKIQMKHSESGNTNVAGFVVDIGSGNPTVGVVNVAEQVGSVNYSYSSGIPHYGNGSVLGVTTSISNAITYVYGSTVAQIGCGGMSTASLSTIDLAINNPQNGEVINLSKYVTLNSNAFTQTSLFVNGLHPLASTTQAVCNKAILVRIGTVTEGIGSGSRVTTANSDFPAEVNTTPNFPSSSPAQAHDAKIVGGILKHDKTNYSVGFLPVGEDYSGHNDNQYASFVFNLTGKNNATINISGGGTYYDKCWIKLPGMTDWLDTSGYYPGAGTPINNGDPCRDGGGGSKTGFHVTFGANNTSSCGNKVLIRFKMSTGQSITNVSIT